MEFKDRVANKPNRVKLTYEDSGVSSFATVELADEPIEEGTPLNAKNMNLLLNKENDDYIVEQGKAGVWNYRKWASGVAECWCYEEYPNITFTVEKNGGYCNVSDYAEPLKSTLPMSFINGASDTSIQGNANKLFVVGGCWINDNILQFDLYSLQQHTFPVQVDVRWYIIGRWK